MKKINTTRPKNTSVVPNSFTGSQFFAVLHFNQNQRGMYDVDPNGLGSPAK